jgi:predicted AlkP superfamily pyrophosphatase or phosphodiesterase
MRYLILLALWLGIAAPAAAVTLSVNPPRRPNPVILVSIDGFRFDYLKRGKTPVLAALAERGVSGPMRPSFPTQTFPNHYTLVTGLYPDHHGIVDNSMEDPALGRFTMDNSLDPAWWNGGEPLWVTAGAQGLKTASMYWPGSDRVIRGHQPDLWVKYDKAFLADDRVDRLLTWLDLPESERPDFATLYFDIVDTEAHHHGTNSPELTAALVSTDASLGRLIDGLKARGLFQRTNIIVVADHGMADTAPSRLLYLDDIVDPAAIHTVTTGTSTGLSLAPAAPADTLAKLLAPHDHMACWKKADIPARLHYGRNPRVPPVICSAEVGWYITTRERMKTLTFNLGNHGYDPAAPEMAAVFVAEGPAFARGRSVRPFDNVDVQPLMAHLLHLNAPKSDGSWRTFKGVLSAH